MAHELEILSSGNAGMMYIGQTPWHGLGQRLTEEDGYDIAKCMAAAGLDWTVRLDRLRTADGRKSDHYAVTRESDNALLGTVGPRYTPLQNVDAFRWFSPFLEAKTATLHTAGSLRGGSRIWVLTQVSGPKLEVVQGDRVQSFLLLSHGHDGSLAVRVGFTPIRVVCANTLAVAHGEPASKLIRIKHTASMHDNLNNVRDVMDVATQTFVANVAQYRKLAHVHINQADIRRYVKRVLEVEEVKDSDLSARMRNQVEEIVRLGYQGRGNNVAGVKETLWGAYNGLTEYLLGLDGPADVPALEHQPEEEPARNGRKRTAAK